MQKLSLTLFICFVLTVNAFAQTLRVEHLVRVKGQEETEIRAYGIVSGLNGTGDDVKSLSPLALMILRQLANSGVQVPGSDVKGISGIRNSALVEVTARIPGTGARSGDMLDCTVYSMGNAKSLAGGVLSMTTLSTALRMDENSLALGMASGRVTIEQESSPGVGRITNGCRLTADFMPQYIEHGLLTLVIHKEHARPNLANRIAEAINSDPEFLVLPTTPARAINSNSVAVRVPPTYFGDPMDFVERVLQAAVTVPHRVPKVTINERSGTISIDEGVEVRPTLVTHRNFVAEIPAAEGEEEEPPQQFLDLDTHLKFRQMNGENATNLKLKSLQASLNALKATQQDMVDVIKILHKQGAIVGDVVYVD